MKLVNTSRTTAATFMHFLFTHFPWQQRDYDKACAKDLADINHNYVNVDEILKFINLNLSTTCYFSFSYS